MKNKSGEARNAFIYSLISIAIIIIGIIIASGSTGVVPVIVMFSLLIVAIIVSFVARKDVKSIKKEGNAKHKRAAKFAVIIGGTLEIVLILIIVVGIGSMIFSRIF